MNYNIFTLLFVPCILLSSSVCVSQPADDSGLHSAIITSAPKTDSSGMLPPKSDHPEAPTVTATRKYSILIDGAIRDLGKTGSKNKDIISSGLLGFCYDDERTKLKVSIAVYSNADTIFGETPYQYGKSILNVGITTSDILAISAEYENKFLFGEGYLCYLLKKKHENTESNFNYREYSEILKRCKLDSIGYFKENIGWRCYLEMSKVVWKDKTKLSVEGNILSLGVMATMTKRYYPNDAFDIEVQGGIGATSRLILSELANNHNFRKKLLNAGERYFFGSELYFHMRINNSFVKISFPVLSPFCHSIEGLTGGQFIVSAGINADIGFKHSEKLSVEEIARGFDLIK